MSKLERLEDRGARPKALWRACNQYTYVIYRIILDSNYTMDENGSIYLGSELMARSVYGKTDGYRVFQTKDDAVKFLENLGSLSELFDIEPCVIGLCK